MQVVLNGNAFNRLAEYPLKDLCVYNRMDAMFCYRLRHLHREGGLP